MKSRQKLALATAMGLLSSIAIAPATPSSDPLIIIGAGVGGLSAAWEAGRRGTPVLLIDRFSVFGGHAVMSGGGLCLVDTPLQREKGIQDSPELAEKDFLAWGGNVDREWVRVYVQRSRADLYDWLRELGVQFDTVGKRPGNSVARFHQNAARGMGVVLPIYQQCLRYPNIRYLWNTEVTQLEQHQGRIDGVTVRNVRSGGIQRLKASAVILATGGYQSNRKLLRSVWPKGSKDRFPEEMLSGSGVNATGSGLELGRAVGATITRLDHQWNYPWGIRDPQRPGSGRGLTVEMWDGIWVNDKGQRFVNEILNPRDALAAVLTQLGQSYWGVMDNIGKSSFYVRGTGWDNPAKVDRLILDNSEITRKANSLRELAKIMGLPVGNFEQTISRWNEMVQRGADLDFGRFGPRRPDPLLLVSWANAKSRPLEQPPFYAVRMYPIARKSLGGLRIDHHCRVLNDASAAIPGLYAVGEVTGFGGVNGSAGLEGTFIGPSLLQGRIVGELLSAGRSIVAPQNWKPVERVSRSVGCTNCHSVQRLAEEKRRGFEHSALVHTVVKARSFACETCHGEMVPYEAKVHRIDRSTQSQTCAVCHLARE